MNKNHVCNLELSKKLRDLKVPQESDFCWIEYENSGVSLIESIKIDYRTLMYSKEYGMVSTFTIPELDFYFKKFALEENVVEWFKENDVLGIEPLFLTADEKASLLVWLIEKGFIKL